MNSSNCYRVQIMCGDRLAYEGKLDPFDLPFTAKEHLPVCWHEDVELAVSRDVPDQEARLKLGDEVVGHLPCGIKSIRRTLTMPFRSELGESPLSVEHKCGGDDEDGLAPSYEPVIRVIFQVRPKPEVYRDYMVMMGDLDSIHQGLAQDVISRGSIPRGVLHKAVTPLYPQAILETLETVHAKLSRAVANIAQQPSSVLVSERTYTSYRPGDRTDASTISSLARGSGGVSGRRVTRLGRVWLRRSVIAQDIEEHRHIAHGIRSLANKAGELAGHCSKMAAFLDSTGSDWSSAPAGEQSVYEIRDLPRVQALTECADRTRVVQEAYRSLLSGHSFLKHAARPRTSFGPTPIFQGRAAYRQAYRALLEARNRLGILVDGERIRMHYRSLPALYEYWCFMKTYMHLRGCLGQSIPKDTFSIIDDVYCPELQGGQSFVFHPAPAVEVKITYTPSIHPWPTALRNRDEYGATLTSRPLRPDILLEVRREGSPPACMVLDAKSADVFDSYKRLRELSDYSRQVFHVPTGTQPIRYVCLLHRDRGSRRTDNIPQSLHSSVNAHNISFIGASPCVPEFIGQIPEDLARMLDLFLEQQVGRCG